MSDQNKEPGLLNFFIQCLQDLYAAEKKFVKCATALSIASYTKELQDALMSQSKEAEQHVERLDFIFKLMEKKAGEDKCMIIDMWSEKSACILKTVETGTAVRDSAIIYTVQLIAHYKIASYGSLIPLAAEIGYPEARVFLEQGLADEKNADAYLSQIATNFINHAAKKESE
jgi:ferritin-like metal-binding protein YciE